jgi:hypothetical protein
VTDRARAIHTQALSLHVSVTLGVRVLLTLVRTAGEEALEEVLAAAEDVLHALPSGSLRGDGAAPWTVERATQAASFAALQRWLAAHGASTGEQRAWACALALARARGSPASALELALVALRHPDAAACALPAAEARGVASGTLPVSEPDATPQLPLRGTALACAFIASARAAPPLLPPHPAGRRAARAWSRWLSCWSCSRPRSPRLRHPKMKPPLLLRF